ncbi:acylphosphatase [Nesterenkonia muleiensis]|uniref:acylphosphatase n=1 Tax=Nesterenkonia muleiensis TaxID=2282648 RepID=UPI000E7381FF|nr:acylphosphatase [Nesterenkonia muleiensis]
MDSDFSSGTFARITGRVQGVNYRNSAKRRADELGVTGWVRNTSDGAVELLTGGDATAVDELITWCHQGPRHAQVAEVETRQATAEQLAGLPGEGFEVRR